MQKRTIIMGERLGSRGMYEKHLIICFDATMVRNMHVKYERARSLFPSKTQVIQGYFLGMLECVGIVMLW